MSKSDQQLGKRRTDPVDDIEFTKDRRENTHVH